MRWLLSAVMLFSMVHAGNFTLSSDMGGQFEKKNEFNGFGCDGANMSPALSWKDAPKGTKSFALTVHDPDAPTGSGWWHWVVLDIPASTTSLPEDAGNIGKKLMPKGAIQSLTNFGVSGFGGACPPIGHGFHRYVFTLHALDVASLKLDAGAMPPLAGYMINKHTIGKASLIAYYQR